MKKLKYNKIGSFLLGVLRGSTLTAPTAILGAVKGVITETTKLIEENRKRKEGGEGKVDWSEIIGLIILAVLIIAYLLGWIDETQFTFIFEATEEVRGN